MKNFYYLLSVKAIIRPDSNRLNDLPYNEFKWMDFDQSFYNHIIINENVSTFIDKFDKTSIKKIKNMFKPKKICNIPIKSVSERIIPYLEYTCDGPSKCSMYSIYQDKDKYSSFLYKNVRTVQYGYKNLNNINWKKLIYKTEFIYNKNVNIYSYLTYQSPDIYFIDISKSIKSISFPFLIQFQHYFSKYITLGFNENIIQQLKKNNKIKDQCEINYKEKEGIYSQDCGLKIDRQCLFEEAFKEFKFKSYNKNMEVQNYLNCYSIERNNDFNDNYLKNNQCEEFIPYNFINEIDVINEINDTEILFKFSSPLFDFADSKNSLLEFMIKNNDEFKLIYGIIRLISIKFNLLNFNLPKNLDEAVKKFKTYNKKNQFIKKNKYFYTACLPDQLKNRKFKIFGHKNIDLKIENYRKLDNF